MFEAFIWHFPFYLDRFVYGKSGQNSCPPGYSYITSIDECQLAATTLGQSYSSSEILGTFPRGCYLYSKDNRVWFNDVATGGAQKLGKLLCIRGMIFCLY